MLGVLVILIGSPLQSILGKTIGLFLAHVLKGGVSNLVRWCQIYCYCIHASLLADE